MGMLLEHGAGRVPDRERADEQLHSARLTHSRHSMAEPHKTVEARVN
jgi:hypothetical protein